MNPISVLLVDDNPTFVRILTRFLRDHNHKEVAALGAVDAGEKALAQALRLRPDIVLIDLAMPGLSGLEAIGLLRSMIPDMGIIALTLLDANAYRDAALAAGANGFVSKATLSTDLLPAIRRVMRARPPRGREGVSRGFRPVK